MADRPRSASRAANWLRRTPSASRVDFADLGTAFGLDQAMTPDESTSTVAPAPAAPRGVSRWWRRARGGAGGTSR